MITVITPSIHPDRLDILDRSLKRQTFKDFEWIVVGPDKMNIGLGTFVKEPPMDKGDFYCLNKAWNKAFAEAKGDLIVSYQDNIWIPPDTLERLNFHFEDKPNALIGTIGHQYSDLDDKGIPINMTWRDPRARGDLGVFYETQPSEIEFSFCSVPKKAIYDVGGLDEIYDIGPAVGEKEMCWRMDKIGYKFYLDQSIEYKALQHPRQTSDWDEKYTNVISPLFSKHMLELSHGTRNPNVGFIEKYS